MSEPNPIKHHRRGRVYMCGSCGVRKEKTRAISHYLEEHLEENQIPFMCNVCNFKAAENTIWRKHLTQARHRLAIKKNPALDNNEPQSFLKKGNKAISIKITTNLEDKTAHLYELSKTESIELWNGASSKSAKQPKKTAEKKKVTPEPSDKSNLSVVLAEFNEAEIRKLLVAAQNKVELPQAIASITDTTVPKSMELKLPEEKKRPDNVQTPSLSDSDSEESETGSDSSTSSDSTKATAETELPPASGTSAYTENVTSQKKRKLSVDENIKDQPAQEGKRQPSGTPRDTDKYGEIHLDTRADMEELCYDPADRKDVPSDVRRIAETIAEAITAKVAQPAPVNAFMTGIANQLVDLNTNIGTLIGNMGVSTEDKSTSALRATSRHIETMKNCVFQTAEDLKKCARGVTDAIRDFNITNQNLRTSINSLVTQIKLNNDLLISSLGKQSNQLTQISKQIQSQRESVLADDLLKTKENTEPNRESERSRDSYESYHTAQGRAAAHRQERYYHRHSQDHRY